MNELEQPRQEIALNALTYVRKVLDEHSNDDWFNTDQTQKIDHILYLTYARLRMAARDGRTTRWLAKVVSFSSPRFLSSDKERKMPQLISFEVEITDGAKSARGKWLEVQMTPVDALRFAQQVARMAEIYLRPNEIIRDDQFELGKLLPESER